MLISVTFVVVGLVLLATAPDRFVAGAAGLASRLGLSAVVIGAVVVGFGTSAPEMLVSGLAAAGGEPEIGIGNIVGSNIANLTLVLGCAALVAPVAMPRGVLRKELPLTAAAMAVFALLVQSGLTRLEGSLLAVGIVAAVLLLLRGARSGEDSELIAEAEEYLEDEAGRSPARIALDVVGGLVGTVLGAQVLVTGAVDIADEVGLSEGFVGLTLVAVGTSLPELLTSVAASRRGEDQLIIGNLLGSNMFNSLAVSGVMGLAGPAVVTDASLTVVAVQLMFPALALGVWAMSAGGRVRRYEGLVLLGAWLLSLPLVA